ncbi:MAG TPA: ankyrin repeat domain-containing protein [Solirubrobacteraceae bacterium]|nr:ankyrin repeat domain-containing protein [Solirubrobacteraceae bacterium]
MPPRGLPGNANLEQLKNGAKSFQRAVRAGDSGAAELVREFHPRLGNARPGSSELDGFSRSDALLVVARSFGFASWPKLRAHLETAVRHARSPHAPVDEDRESLADRFLRLACLTYGGDDPARWQQARELLAAHPELATASIHTIAATGDVAAARELLTDDPGQASAQGGPHDWEPLLYLTYSRLGVGDPVEVARLLLDHGADSNAGYMWEGLSPPFTALTGAFGSGEGGPPRHPQWEPLARVLLDAGADPNDEQTLYNCHWDADDDWLQLLFEYGLGSGDGGPWHRLLAPAHATPAEMLEDQLIAAAHHGFTSRVRLLLDHGVDPEGLGTRHPIYQGRSPSEDAAISGHPEIVAMLARAGARSGQDDLHRFMAGCMVADHATVEQLLRDDRTLVQRAIARHPDQIVRAAETERLDAVALLIELGFDVNAMNRSAPLHEAAMRGNLELIDLLLVHGADPNQRDRSYDATPAGWADHHNQSEAQERLSRLET